MWRVFATAADHARQPADRTAGTGVGLYTVRHRPPPSESAMHIQYSWTPDVSQMSRSVRARLRPRLRRYPVLAVLYAVVAAAMFAVGVRTEGDPSAFIVGCASVAVAVLYAVWPSVAVRRLADRQLKLAGLPTTMTLTENEIVCETAAVRMTWSWAAFNSVLAVPGYWVLRVNGVDAMVLDQGLLSAEQLSEVHTFLAARGLVAATYQIA